MRRLNNPLFEILRSDAFIQANKALRWAIGNDEATIYAELLSRNAYFSDTDKLTSDGFFFNTLEDLYAGTHINERAQRSAVNSLKQIGLINVEIRGIPAKRYFKVIDAPDLLADLLRIGKEKARNAFINASSAETQELAPAHQQTNKKKNNGEATSRENLTPETTSEAHFKPAHELRMLQVVGSLTRRKPGKSPW